MRKVNSCLTLVRPRPNGEARTILDLTKLNTFVHYEHFKMFSRNTAIDLLTPGAWMGMVDLKQAYYSVTLEVPQVYVGGPAIRIYGVTEWLGCLFETVYTITKNPFMQK